MGYMIIAISNLNDLITHHKVGCNAVQTPSLYGLQDCTPIPDRLDLRMQCKTVRSHRGGNRRSVLIGEAVIGLAFQFG